MTHEGISMRAETRLKKERLKAPFFHLVVHEVSNWKADAAND